MQITLDCKSEISTLWKIQVIKFKLKFQRKKVLLLKPSHYIRVENNGEMLKNLVK